jgi:hypothetical protein
MCDEDREFALMLVETGNFVRLHGTPTSMKIRSEWFISLAGSRLMSQHASPRYEHVDPSFLQVPLSSWTKVKPLLMRLLSEHPSERVSVLYDDAAWDGLAAGVPCRNLRGGGGGESASCSSPPPPPSSSSPSLAVMMKYGAIPSGKMLDDAVTLLDTRRIDTQLLATVNQLCVGFEEYCLAHRCTLLMPDDANIHQLRWVCALAVIDVAVDMCGSFGAASQNVVVEVGKYVKGDHATLALFSMIDVLWGESGVASAALARMVDAKYRVRALDWLLDHSHHG